MNKAKHWMIADQRPEALANHGPGVCWVCRCLRCGKELPIHEGPLDAAISLMDSFNHTHGRCKEKGGQADGKGE